MTASGIYGDGWVQQRSRFALPPGDAGALTIRADVLPEPQQRLEVILDGRVVSSERIDGGAMDLRIPVEASTAARSVELRWAVARPLAEDDPREASALLRFLDITPARAPATLRVPAGLGSSGLDYGGIAKDGWADANAHVVLAGGAAGELVVRAFVPDVPFQHVEVVVDGRSVVSHDVGRGNVELRAPVGSSAHDRHVALRFSNVGPVGADDPRQAAALLSFVGIATSEAPAAIRRVPDDLLDPSLIRSGIYDDGWMTETVEVVLAGGPAGDLVFRAHVHDQPHQHVEVLVGGDVVASHPAPPGPLELRVPLKASATTREIELRWAASSPVGPGDGREAAALLTFLGVGSGRAPSALRRFPADLADADLVAFGIYSDGWLEQQASVVLAGGGPADLVLAAQVPRQLDQHLTLTVDGEVVFDRRVGSGPLTLRVPLAAARADRRVELGWATAAPVGPNDLRTAAALLELLALSPKQSE